MPIGSAGVAAAIGIGGLLVPVRDVIGNTNVALVLVVVIVAAATFGGRIAGAMTAGAACLSFNSSISQPLYTLRVRSADDIWTIALLFVIGLVVGQLAVFARSNQARAIIERAGITHLEEVGALVAQDQPPNAVWDAVQAALLDELRLVGATFEPGDHPDGPMATLERTGKFDNKVMFWSREGIELPRDGVVLPVQCRNQNLRTNRARAEPGPRYHSRPATGRRCPGRPLHGDPRPPPARWRRLLQAN